MPRILIVEDESKLRKSLQQGLEEEGYEVIAAESGEDAVSSVAEFPPDAIVVDWMLPGIDGLEFIRNIRGQGHRCPALILTARDSVEDRVQGLDAGADDYLVKPFAFAELAARLRVIFRRNPIETMLRADDLEVDLISGSVRRGGQELVLTPREFELLKYLLRNKNGVVTREMICVDVWKENSGVLTNVIDVCIKQLRRKIEFEGRPPLIQTVRGQGYCLRDGGV